VAKGHGTVAAAVVRGSSPCNGWCETLPPAAVCPTKNERLSGTGTHLARMTDLLGRVSCVTITGAFIALWQRGAARLSPRTKADVPSCLVFAG
jgi:hypothetical protein